MNLTQNDRLKQVTSDTLIVGVDVGSQTHFCRAFDWRGFELSRILFATPVYWWGMSAQLKLIIDKCYCRGLQLKNKKVGTIVVGGSPVDSIQYELIDKQFDCMAKYLSWDMLFKKSYYATAKDELEKNKDSMNELEGIGKNL